MGMDGNDTNAAYSGLQHHISPDLLESYAFGTLSPADGDRVEHHLAMCEECRHYAIQAEWSFSLVATAARKAAGLVAVHETADGTVLLMLRRHSDRWLARLRGASLDGGSFVEDRAAGVAWCHQTFATMFPEHTCTAQCRVFVERPAAGREEPT